MVSDTNGEDTTIHNTRCGICCAKLDLTLDYCLPAIFADRYFDKWCTWYLAGQL